MLKDPLAQTLTKIVPFGLQQCILNFLVRIVAVLVKTPKIRFAGTTVHLMPNDRSSARILVSFWIWGRWSHESFQQNIVEQFIRTRDNGVIFVDGGASFGMYSLLAANQDKTRLVVAVEADADTFNRLDRTVSESHFAQRISCIHAALVDQANRKVAIHRIGEVNSEWSQVRVVDSATEASPLIPSMTIADILESIQLQQSDSVIIKLDIEGAEPLAIAGMKSLLEEERDTVVFLEFHTGVLNILSNGPEKFANELWNTNMAEIYSINEQHQTLERIGDLDTFLKLTENLCKKEFPHNLTNLLLVKKPLTALDVPIRAYGAK